MTNIEPSTKRIDNYEKETTTNHTRNRFRHKDSKGRQTTKERPRGWNETNNNIINRMYHRNHNRWSHSEQEPTSGSFKDTRQTSWVLGNMFNIKQRDEEMSNNDLWCDKCKSQHHPMSCPLDMDKDIFQENDEHPMKIQTRDVKFSNSPEVDEHKVNFSDPTIMEKTIKDMKDWGVLSEYSV